MKNAATAQNKIVQVSMSGKVLMTVHAKENMKILEAVVSTIILVSGMLLLTAGLVELKIILQ